MSSRFAIDDRLPVWAALSEIFIDSELSDRDVVRIAKVLVASPFDVSEIATILFDEILPVFAPNLVSVAGSWTAWDQDEVLEIMEQAQAKPYLARCAAHLLALPVRSIVRADWERIAPLLVDPLG